MAIDRARLVQTLVGVHGFYDRELSEFAIRIWAEALDGMPIAAVDEAFARHLRDPEAGRWLPKPADILRQLRGDAEQAALIAWGEVLAAARSGKATLDPVAREAVQSLGGMSVIQRADESQNGFLQRRFCDAFKAYRARAEAPPLLGADNVLKLRDGTS